MADSVDARMVEARPVMCDRCGQPGATVHEGTFNFHRTCPPVGRVWNERELYDRLPDAEWLIARRLREATVPDKLAERLASYAAMAALEAFTDHDNYQEARRGGY